MSKKVVGFQFTCCYVFLILAWSCSPSNVKMTSFPKLAGYRTGESILLTPLAQLKDQENAQLMDWANEVIVKKLPSIKTKSFWDVQYESKKFGFILPSFNKFDTSFSNQFQGKLDVDFILVADLTMLRENYTNELSNPNYQKREAIVSFQLFDLKSKSITWQGSTRVIANPFKVKGESQKYTVNVFSGNYAVQKAYKESITRLTKSFVLVD